MLIFLNYTHNYLSFIRKDNIWIEELLNYLLLMDGYKQD